MMMSTLGTLHTPKQVADRRAQAPHTSMFARMLLRAAVLRRTRAASALLAMIVAAAVATAMMNLYVDVQAKLRTEFRNYGANVVIVAKDGQSLPADALAKVESVLGAKTMAVPFSYAVARTKAGQSVVVVGTDFTRARQLNRWWKVSHWPDAPNEALIGMRAAAVVNPNASPNRQPFELTFQAKRSNLLPRACSRPAPAKTAASISINLNSRTGPASRPPPSKLPPTEPPRKLKHRFGSSRSFYPPPTSAPSA